MKISSIESAKAGQITPVGSGTGVAAVTPPASGTGPAASVELSSTAQARTAARAEAVRYVPAVNAVPDREDKIADLKSRIDAGTYQVSGQDIASQILRRAQADKIQ